MMNTLPSQVNYSKKSNGSNQKECFLSQLLTEEEIAHHQKIEAIESTLHSTIRKLMMEYDPSLVAEALEWFVERLRESKRRVSDSMA